MLATVALLSCAFQATRHPMPTAPPRAVAPAATRVGRGPSCAVMPVGSQEAYKRVVASTSDTEQLAVIMFSSERCRACASVRPKLKEMSDGWPEVEWHEMKMEHGDNKALFKELEISKLPHVQMARKGDVIESYTCGPKRLPTIEEKFEEQGLERRQRWRRLRRMGVALWESRDMVLAPAVVLVAMVLLKPWKLMLVPALP